MKNTWKNHYSAHQLIGLDYQKPNHIHEKYFDIFMINYIDFNEVAKGDYSFIDEKLLKNIIQSLYGTYSIAIKSSEKGIKGVRS